MKRRLAFLVSLFALLLAALPAYSQAEPLVFSTSFGNPRVEFSPDGSRMAIFEDANYAIALEVPPTPETKAIQIYDVAAGELVATLTGARDFTSSLLFTPDGAQIHTAHANGDLLTWDAVSGEMQSAARTMVNGPRIPLFWHPRSGELIIGGQSSALNSYMVLAPISGAATLLITDPPTVTYSDYVALMRERGPQLLSHSVVVPAPHSDALSALPLSGDEVWVANPQGQVALFSLSTGVVQVLREGDQYPMFNINDIVATPSGLVGFTVGNEDTLYLYDLISGEETELAVEHPTALLSPDGGQIAQFDADEAGLLLQSALDGSKTGALAFPEGLTAGPRSFLRLRYSPDGTRLAATGLKDANDQSVIVLYDL